MASATAKRHRMRCGHRMCWRRYTLRKHPDKYVRPVKCPHCGNRKKQYSVEGQRRRELQKRKEKRLQCYCNRYPFPHQKGSLRMCDHHPAKTVEPTEEEYVQYQQCLETPRSW